MDESDCGVELLPFAALSILFKLEDLASWEAGSRKWETVGEEVMLVLIMSLLGYLT